MWIADPMSDDKTDMLHWNGTPWFDAPRPRRFHRCKAQTKGWFNYVTHVQRCACGATNIDRLGWLEKNSRKGR